MLEQTHRKYFPDGFPTESMISLTGGDFRVAGEIMAMSVIQGGPAPNFLAPVVFSYLSKVQLSPHNNSTQLYKDAAIRVRNTNFAYSTLTIFLLPLFISSCKMWCLVP